MLQNVNFRIFLFNLNIFAGLLREPELSPLQLCLENVHRTLQRLVQLYLMHSVVILIQYMYMYVFHFQRRPTHCQAMIVGGQVRVCFQGWIQDFMTMGGFSLCESP